ncbi:MULTISPECIES: cytochrome o ubiquinol oxidase subunit IV [Brevibacillus]|uniref:Cytochrome o ubiquinol oxidase subunit IV n=1 Tax=Brevibacillus parabrevis TaxID=54914 RepID=A0A4Y3PIZ1_BREPA|nr:MULTISPECIES: cytochrome o ubiquinol oxidase subunit IV [Brevibacillus]NRQ55955.1 cytochrome o ubiquinol oxidase subunit IV [Brevibacillus sp. HD1.4A]TGV03294.1 cytochrome o ubiquinol oxidase subunit IV [Mesorhizobium sp. M00.F.Ca.ET.186.01.1.1]KZE48145.1 cytochrome o ubiquinol oxidase subunit IV [Brevibacillus parabrevis]MBU8715867.1 cytochrome o ubiquinol oxidase subunit IV [Brevibacillus parabrevis]MDH6352531.1 cytochrome o ubiquinol oxidase operon protein cyoD [Brevibacillus sp. 1238]
MSNQTAHGSLKSYVTGFICSIVLTIIPIVVLVNNWLEGLGSTIVFLAAALLQFIVQLVFFMHLKDEEKPRYNLMSLLLGIFIVLLIVVGSIWIMMYNMVAI